MLHLLKIYLVLDQMLLPTHHRYLVVNLLKVYHFSLVQQMLPPLHNQLVLILVLHLLRKLLFLDLLLLIPFHRQIKALDHQYLVRPQILLSQHLLEVPIPVQVQYLVRVILIHSVNRRNLRNKHLLGEVVSILHHQ